MPTSSKLDPKHISQVFYQTLVAQHVMPPPIASNDLERFEYHQDGIAAQLESELTDQIGRRDYSPEMQSLARHATVTAGFDFESLPASERMRILEGIARAQVEFVRYTRFRQSSALDAYAPSDALFSSSDKEIPAAALVPPQPTIPSHRQGGTGGRLADLIDRYLEAGISRGTTEKRGPWTLKTRDEKARSLNWFAGLVGADLDVCNIAHEHVREYRDAVSCLRKGASSKSGLQDAKASNAKEKVDPKTAKKHLDFVKEFLIWMASEGYIHNVPGRSIHLAAPPKAKSESRRPFTEAETETFFSSPIYSGCKSSSYRHLPGSKIIRDDDYWLPLALFFTGARLNEMVQIAAEDVIIDGPYPHFSFQRAKMKLKTLNAERSVPIHPDLFEFGFASFVRERQKTAPAQPLFRGFKSEGNPKDYISQRLGRYRRRIGITDKRAVAHSWRHNVADLLREANFHPHTAESLTGHSHGSQQGAYGTGAKLKATYEAFSKLEFGLSKNVRAILTPPSKFA